MNHPTHAQLNATYLDSPEWRMMIVTALNGILPNGLPVLGRICRRTRPFNSPPDTTRNLGERRPLPIGIDEALVECVQAGIALNKSRVLETCVCQASRLESHKHRVSHCIKRHLSSSKRVWYPRRRTSNPNAMSPPKQKTQDHTVVCMQPNQTLHLKMYSE